MDKAELDRIIANEREWRNHTHSQLEKVFNKIEKVDDELRTFKFKVLSFAIFFGGISGISSNKIFSLFF